MIKSRTGFFLLTVSLIAAGLAACGAGSPQGPSKGTGDGATLASISITPVNAALAKNTDQQFVATGVYSDKSTRDLTKYVTWTSSDSSTAEIDSPGHVKGKKSGSATIKASSGDIEADTTVSVTDATLVSIAVTPTGGSIAKGTTQRFTAVGTFSDGTTQDLTASAVWTSSSQAVATVSSGLATAVSAGSTTITAASENISASATLTVTSVTLASISVTPTNPSIAKGTAQQFIATGTFSDNSVQDLTEGVSWSSSSTGVASISNDSGSRGAVTSVAVGSTTISATSGGISGSTTLTVTSATLVSIAVTPSSPSIAKGTAQQFVAIGTYSDGSTQTLTNSVAWESSNQAVATVSNAAGSQGAATSLAVGSTTVAASSGSISGSAALTVTSATLISIAVTPSNPSIAKGTAQQFAATGTYTDGSTQVLTNSVTWSSSSTGIATISNATGARGAATSVAVGSTTITATSGSVLGSTTLAVTSATLVSIAVTPSNPSIGAGTTQQFVATGAYTDGSTQVLTNSATWSSSSTGVATISNASGSKGLASGVAAGSASITATSGGVSGTTGLTVVAGTSALTLTWDAPTTYVDGSTLSSLTAVSSYRIYYGTSSLSYNKTVDVPNPGVSVVTYTLNLSAGTYYFAVTDLDISGQESSYSNEVWKTL